jgi:hypothetical protein
MCAFLSCVAISCSLLGLGSLLSCHVGVLLATVLQISRDLTAASKCIRGVCEFIQIL